MADKLFNETFFKKNNYFRKELNLSKDRLMEIQSLIANWQKNCESFNPDVDKETTDENEFVDVLFKKILGYSGKGKDAESYTIYPKFKIEGASNTGKAGFADLALGNFSKSESPKSPLQKGTFAEVVVEFKGQNSDDLTKTSNRPDKLSPVDQCWKYLLNHNSAKWGLVTNFNEIRIYNKEKGQNSYETFYFNVPEEYEDKFQPLSTETEILKLITILKKENLLTTNGISNTEELLKNKGVEETKVQKEFYQAYKALRSQIFYEALKHNPQYESEKPKSELLQLVQKLLDRVIFCWFCEDSREHLIPTNVLSAELIQAQTKDKYYNPQHFSIYGKVKDLFQAIDEGRAFGIDHGYNGELFKPDAALDSLKLPNFLFEKIAEIGMQYDFGDENELNVNILGHIFEQSISDLEEMRVSFQELDQSPKKIEKQHVMEFAKEVDILAHKHTEFDAKKTKRKKEGVFYTPDYITRYIVENTVGVWLKEKEEEVTKKYAQLKKNKEYTILREYRDEHLSKIKILDPACGSGAFLIAAFNYLWKEHERVYTAIKEIKNKTAQGELFDFDSINKTILENNLYGVDLNRESVEITKLALWLKTAAKNKKLNSLHNNIKCGNSLVDDKSIVGNDLAFDWKERFSDIMNAGGFDVVVGNPPYVQSRSEFIGDAQKSYFNQNYKTAQYQLNTYTLFVEKSFLLMKEKSILGFIIPNYWLSTKYDEYLRTLVFNTNHTKEIINTYGVFDQATVDTVILITAKDSSYPKKIKVRSLDRAKTDITERLKDLTNQSWNFQNEIIVKNEKQSVEIVFDTKLVLKGKHKLSDYFEFKQGLKPYQVGKGNPKQTQDILDSKKFDSKIKIDDTYFPLLRARDIKRNQLLWKDNFIKYGEHLAEPRSLNLFSGKRILIRRIINGDYLDGIYLEERYLSNTDLISLIPKKNISINPKVLLPIINSRLYATYLKKSNVNLDRDAFPKINVNTMEEIPIPEISKSIEKEFIRLADVMLNKNKELQEVQKKFITLLVGEFKLEKLSEKLEDWYLLDWSEFISELKKKKIALSAKDEEKWLDRFERLRKEALSIKAVIDSTDKEIDRMVYELYGLTKDEREIVEGGK